MVCLVLAFVCGGGIRADLTQAIQPCAPSACVHKLGLRNAGARSGIDFIFAFLVPLAGKAYICSVVHTGGCRGENDEEIVLIAMVSDIESTWMI